MQNPEVLRAGWLSGDSLACGRVFLQSLSRYEQGLRAASLAQVLCQHFDEMVELRQIAEIGLEPARWLDAYDAFGELRSRLLQRQACDAGSLQCDVLLCAELCAKTIYNGTTPVAGFDFDSSWYLFPVSAAVVRGRGVPALTNAVWGAITGRWLHR